MFGYYIGLEPVIVVSFFNSSKLDNQVRNTILFIIEHDSIQAAEIIFGIIEVIHRLFVAESSRLLTVHRNRTSVQTVFLTLSQANLYPVSV